MKKTLPAFLFAAVILGGCAEPIALRTFQGNVLIYPDFLPLNQPTILAFLDGNDRRCDKLMKPLRALASRKEVKLVGVLAYDDNSFVEQISTKREIIFPLMLDPRKKLVRKIGVSKYPTFVYLSPHGKEIARSQDLAKIQEWYRPSWIHRAFGRKYSPSDEDLADEEVR